MAKRYMTDEVDRAVVVVTGLELQQDMHLARIRESISNEYWKSILWRVNVLRAIADLLNRPKGRAYWYNQAP